MILMCQFMLVLSFSGYLSASVLPDPKLNVASNAAVGKRAGIAMEENLHNQRVIRNAEKLFSTSFRQPGNRIVPSKASHS